MKRISGCVLLVLLTLPVQAVAPLAFLAKEIVKSIVRSFVENQMNDMLATSGPCGGPIAGMGTLTGLTGLLGGRGGMPGIPSGGMAMPGLAGAVPGGLANVGKGGLANMPAGLPNMPAGALAAGKIGVGAMPMLDGATMPAGMAAKMQEQIAGAQAMANEQDGAPATGAGGKTPAPDMAKMMQAMQDPTPLASAEVDELGDIMERLSAAVPAGTTKCKPGELKMVLHTAADTPMAGGILRMMLGSMRDMQKSLDEARALFADMPVEQRNEYVENMASEYRGWDKESRQAMLGMIETNFLGMPEDMKTQMLAGLKREK